MYYLEDFCFLCLKPGLGTNSYNISIKKKLEYLLPKYQLVQLQKIPRHICDNCLENLNAFYEFKHKCMRGIKVCNNYVQKLSQENSTYKYLSVGLADILYKIESDTDNLIEFNVGSLIQKLKEEIIEINNCEHHQTVEVQQQKENKDHVPIKIENEINYLESKTEITEELLIKDDNSDLNVLDDIFECETCLLTFDTEILLMKHTFVCENKQKSIEAMNQLQSGNESDDSSDAAIDTSTKIEESPCAFSRVSTLKNHKIHSDVKPYRCNVCEKTFSQKFNLISHKRIHTGEKPYECDVCRKTCNHKSNLIKHKRIHTGEKPYICDVCTKSFTQSTSLNMHKFIHTGVKPYKYICKKSFSQAANLNEHKQIHTGEKPHKCNVCQKTFTRKVHLNHHGRIHTGEKPFKCNFCEKTFGRKYYFIQHKRIHTGERPYECDVCKKSFSHKSNLNRHKRIHIGEKPYKCDLCTESFTQSTTPNLHECIQNCKKTILM